MSTVNKNQPNFFGNDGLPLKSGFIYIGQVGQDAQTFPKTVTFTDSAGGNFTAAQPLRTNSDGQITYNGKAIIASVDGSYSMLILDQNSVQIRGGWVPTVTEASSGGSTDLAAYRRYKSILSDVKKVDVATGQTIGNIGRLTSNDSLGESWIAASATGSPADDVDIIDFDNGLQGLRIKNYTKPTNNGSDFTNLPSLRANISVYSKAESDSAFIEDGTGAVSNANLATDSVSTIKMQDDSITGDKLDDTGSAEKMGLLLTAGTIASLSVTDAFVGSTVSYDAYSYLIGGDRTLNGNYSFIAFGAGTITIDFDYRTSNGGTTANFRILKNGSQVDAVSTTSASFTTRSFNLAGLLPGDCITIQGKEDGGLANDGIFTNIYAKANKLFICKDLTGIF